MMEKGYILKKNDLLLSKLFRLRVDTVSEKKKKNDFDSLERVSFYEVP